MYQSKSTQADAMVAQPPRQALIYCRVSSRAQEADGNGLQSQETRCREFATANGHEVMAVFPDTITGGGTS
ncbi:recombinase family protein [Sulfitobacter pacificus]|uniref:recombinase family protein n=1 Tax=Sulfitobacter pacificus TaxID=1499314 RepID=UPI003613DEA3